MDILEFSADNFAHCLANQFSLAEEIAQKQQFKYLHSYLERLGALSILREEKYISKDYLHDYAHYYSLCFEDYSKFCHRLHFFSAKIDPKQLNFQLLNIESDEWWNDNYLGFIVIRPIPSTVVGFTVLRDFNHKFPEILRSFWGSRNYPVHIFGKEVIVRSLAFQEQDSVVAACATTAVWSMLQKAAMNYDTVLKSPSQITRDADLLSIDGSRLFPNKNGLTILQICQAIQKSGLVCEVKQGVKCLQLPDGKYIYTHPNSRVKQIVNSYSSLGIPIILGIFVPNGESWGGHAITVVGSKKENQCDFHPQMEVSWGSSDMKKLYCHDDQFGPFVRVEFETTQNEPDCIVTPWSELCGLPTYVTEVIVPLYPKIRISLEDIEDIIYLVDAIFSETFADRTFDFVWDIKLLFSEQYKDEIKQNSEFSSSQKLEILQMSMPKYMWIAKCKISEFWVCDIIFDATGLAKSMLCIKSIFHNELYELIREFIESNPDFINKLFHGLNGYIAKIFEETLVDQVIQEG